MRVRLPAARMPAANAIAGIDHALVGVRDLETARAQWQALGFTVTPRGRHIGWGTANYCIMFDAGYIELLGIVDPAQFTNDLDRFLAVRQGLLGLAFRSSDAAATRRWLAAAGLHPDGPNELKRTLELPGGEVLPAFRLVFLPPAETPGLRAFFCQHLTPELIRRPDWVTHANRTLRLAGVVTVVDDPAALRPAYARLFGDAAVTVEGDSLAVDSDAGELQFVTAAALAQLYPGMTLPAHPAPWVAAMRLAAHILADTADWLDARQLAPLPTPRGVALPPDRASGVILEFVPL